MRSFGSGCPFPCTLRAGDSQVDGGGVVRGLAGGGAGVVVNLVPADPDEVRKVIGVTGQFSAVDNLLTGEENLLLMADLNHLDKAEGRRRAVELLHRFDLTDWAKKSPSTYSGGMRRKLDLAMTLVGDPRVIFLDEPTTGLDPRSRRTMWDAIRQMVRDGVTVFLTTQNLEEADQLADRIALLDNGLLVAEGTADQLKRLIPGGHIRLQFADAAELDAASRAFGGSTRAEDALALQIPSDGGVHSLRAVLDYLQAASIHVESLTVHMPDLDDVFLALTGRRAEEHRTEEKEAAR